MTFNTLRSSRQERRLYLRQELPRLKAWVAQGLYCCLIARDQELQRSVGYLLLNLWHQDDLGRRQTFVEDIAALPDYWGRGLGHALFDAAQATTARLGLDFMAGEVAASNSRWQAALRHGFQLESYRVVRPCTPRGQQILAQAQGENFQERRRQRRERWNSP